MDHRGRGGQSQGTSTARRSGGRGPVPAGRADHGLPVLVLRTSRFFPEGDDAEAVRTAYPNLNVKVNDCSTGGSTSPTSSTRSSSRSAAAPSIGFGRYIITATTPFGLDDRAACDDLPGWCAAWILIRRDLCAAWLEDVPVDRPDLRERAGAARARLDASVTTSAPRSSGSRPGRTRAARWRSRSARRATTPSRRASTPPAESQLIGVMPHSGWGCPARHRRYVGRSERVRGACCAVGVLVRGRSRAVARPARRPRRSRRTSVRPTR